MKENHETPSVAVDATKNLLPVPETATRLGERSFKRVIRNGRKYGALKEIDKTPFIDWPKYQQGVADSAMLKKRGAKAMNVDLDALAIGRLEHRIYDSLPEKISDLKEDLIAANKLLESGKSFFEKNRALKKVEQLEAKLAEAEANLKSDSAELDKLLSDPRWQEEFNKKMASRKQQKS